MYTYIYICISCICICIYIYIHTYSHDIMYIYIHMYIYTHDHNIFICQSVCCLKVFTIFVRVCCMYCIHLQRATEHRPARTAP